MKKGEVYSSAKYYIQIVNVTETEVFYNFYNREQFFFEPNRKRKKLPIILPAVEGKEMLDTFLARVKRKTLKLEDRYFDKPVCVGCQLKD